MARLRREPAVFGALDRPSLRDEVFEAIKRTFTALDAEIIKEAKTSGVTDCQYGGTTALIALCIGHVRSPLRFRLGFWDEACMADPTTGVQHIMKGAFPVLRGWVSVPCCDRGSRHCSALGLPLREARAVPRLLLPFGTIPLVTPGIGLRWRSLCTQQQGWYGPVNMVPAYKGTTLQCVAVAGQSLLVGPVVLMSSRFKYHFQSLCYCGMLGVSGFGRSGGQQVQAYQMVFAGAICSACGG